MSVILDQHRLAYFSVPKIACTSIKQFFFEVENGFPFRRFRMSGRGFNIHLCYPGCRFDAWDMARIEGYLKIAVLRDPVQRALSCYSNRVLFHNELDHLELSAEDQKAGLTQRPDLDRFFTHFDRYRALSDSIRHHSNPMSVQLGDDPGFFDHLFAISDLDRFVQLVRDRVGQAPELGRFQTGGPKFTPDDLSPRHRAALRAFYDEDYRAFSDWF